MFVSSGISRANTPAAALALSVLKPSEILASEACGQSDYKIAKGLAALETFISPRSSSVFESDFICFISGFGRFIVGLQSFLSLSEISYDSS
jgi:hypothetical protein